MDSVSQFVLGSFVSYSVTGKQMGKKSLFYGGFLGTIPDLDFLFISWVSDPIDKILLHRGFSHSLFFVITFSLLFTALYHYKIIWRSYKKSITKKRIFSLIFLCLITHILLDCFTVWGTQIFYPLNYRVAFNSIFIIDPFYTIPFIIVFFIILINKNLTKDKTKTLVNKTLVITTSYLLIALLFQQFILNYAKDEIRAEQHDYDSIFISPSFFNIIVWRISFKKGPNIYSFNASIFDALNNKKIDTLKPKFTENSKIPIIFSQHPRSHEILQKIRGLHAIHKKGKQYFLHDFRFYANYSKYDNLYKPIFSYLIEKKDNALSIKLRENREELF